VARGCGGPHSPATLAEPEARALRSEMSGENRGIHPVPLFRLSQQFDRQGHRIISRAIEATIFVVFRAILPPSITAGYGLDLSHRGLNVVIHPLTTLGNHVRIEHGVTIAHTSRRSDPDHRRTQIGDGVRIGAGAIIVGPVQIGERAVISPGAVVMRDVPADEVWAGNPARRLRSVIELDRASTKEASTREASTREDAV